MILSIYNIVLYIDSKTSINDKVDGSKGNNNIKYIHNRNESRFGFFSSITKDCNYFYDIFIMI